MPRANAAHSRTRPDRIQDGIYFRSSERPPPGYLLLLLNAAPKASPPAVRAAIARVVAGLRGLQLGGADIDLADVDLAASDRAERDDVPTADPLFTFLLGYGARFFDADSHQPELTKEPRPDYLSRLHRQSSAFATIPWALPPDKENQGEADLCIQLTGLNESVVNRTAVEVWKMLVDMDAPISIVATYRGFQRDDGRGWLGFHDGVSNIQPSQRLAALAAGSDPAWNEGGTYMAYLRIDVDLVAWRRLSRTEQEIVVGRDKVTGCPLVAVREKGGRLVPVPAPGCPNDEDPSTFRDPPQQLDPLLESSHLHRANQTRASPTTPSSQRIFRQGYEFLDSISEKGPRLGLNFVSFQRDPESVVRVLGLPGWLGVVNFGGPSKPKAGEPPQFVLLRLLAGGLYAIPPRADPFAGANLFDVR